MIFAAHLTTAGSPPAAAAIEVTGDLPACALVAFTQTGGAGASPVCQDEMRQLL
jgi:hypothetical protein